MKKKFKILLVNPWVTDFSLYDFWMKPLGLLILGSILKKEGYSVYLLDLLDRHNPFFIKKINERELRKIKDKKYSTGKFPSREIKKPEVFEGIRRRYKIYGWYREIVREYLKRKGEFDLILITSGMTYWYPGIRETIDFLKEIYPDAVYILGGRYVSFCREHAEKEFGDLQLVFERNISDILRKIKEIAGIEIDFAFYKDINNIYFDLYLDYPLLKHFAIITSLGCPFKCVYCASKVLFPEFRIFKIDKVISEIEKIYRSKNPKELAFYDDALLYPPGRAKELLKKLIFKEFNLRIHTPNAVHARYIDEEMSELMKKANFKTIRIGFETIDEEKLKKEWAGKHNLEIFEKALYNLRKAGFDEELGAYVLIGLKDDDVDGILRSYEYLYKLKVKIYPAQFSPLPNTFYFDFNKDPLLTNKSIYFFGNPEIGFEKYEKLKDFAKILNRNIKTNYSFKELFQGYLKGYFS